MIILIDTIEKVIEVEGIDNEEETKKVLKDTYKNFKEYEHIIIPPIKINVIPITKDLTVEDFMKNLISSSLKLDNPNDVKPGPPKK